MDLDTLQSAVQRRSRDDIWNELLGAGLSGVADGVRHLTGIRHPLGFVCLPIHRDGPDGVCLHVWSDAVRPSVTTSDLHCHSWHLLSFVLAGAAGNQRIDVVDGTRFRVFRALTRSTTDEIVRTDRLVDAHLRELEIHRAGECYTVAAGEFHTSVAAEPGTVTLCIGRGVPGGADLTLGDPETVPRRTVRQPLTAAETRATARQILALADRTAAPVAG
jgi:hypothetical protein